LATFLPYFDTHTLEEVPQFVLTPAEPGLSQDHQRRFWSVLSAAGRDARLRAGERDVRPPYPPRSHARGRWWVAFVL